MKCENLWSAPNLYSEFDEHLFNNDGDHVNCVIDESIIFHAEFIF